MYFKTNEFAIVMFFWFVMINTTDHGRRTPSLFSATGASASSDGGDHVSILSDLCGEKSEARAASPRLRARWVWWLAAAAFGGAAALVGMKQMSVMQRVSDALPTPVVEQSADRAVVSSQHVDNAVAEAAPAAAVIRDSVDATLPAGAPADAGGEKAAVTANDGGATANDDGAMAILAAPAALPPAVPQPVATSAAARAREKPRRVKARSAPRPVDADVDIITAIVKHAETAPAY